MQAHYTDTFRDSVMSVLGAPPDPAPLQPEVIEVVSGDGFRREKIKYQVSPGDWAYAYLLIPDKLHTPTPAIYVHHRQGGNNWAVGKSEMVGLAGDKDYALALELVQRGYIAFAPDALGFEDRRSPESDGEQYDLAYNFHQLALRLLRGETLLKKVLWDISRGSITWKRAPKSTAVIWALSGTAMAEKWRSGQRHSNRVSGQRWRIAA